MRVGQNPIKSVERVAPSSPVTVVVIVYIPYLTGYYAQSLDILKLCLQSLISNTISDFDLFVFDNGSCKEVREYLLEEHAKANVSMLLLSEQNLGKPAAWNITLSAAPGEFIAYLDSDVYFYPGWLEASMRAFKDFDSLGMVTAMPILTPEKYSTSTIRSVKKQRGVKVQHKATFPWQDFWRHARSLGDTQEKARRFYDRNPATLINFRGRSYYSGAAHFQFTARKSVLADILPIPAERPMGTVRMLDKAINKAGYLRLCTSQWYVQHLGNTLPQDSDLLTKPVLRIDPRRHRAAHSRFWQWQPIRKLLQWINGWSFDRLHRTK
jgi:glycosyltransferase involved in cell wall biosynthesis